jgi:hypothetical protein
MENTKSLFEELSALETQLASQVALQEPSPAAAPAPTSTTPPAEGATTAPANEPVVAATPPVTPAPVVPADSNSVVDSWDEPQQPSSPASAAAPAAATAPAPAVPPIVATSLDVSELAKVLKKDAIKTKDEVFSELETTVKQAELISALPEQMKSALEIAALGGNYLEYLGISQIDWTKEDPITLYENYVEDQFTNAQGQTDFERVEKLLDRLDDDEKELRGRELQRQYVTYQAQQKAAIESQARQQKASFESNLRSAVDSLSDIAGFKLSPAHKEELYAYVVSGADLKQPDIKTRIFNAFVTKYWPKLDAYRKQQIKNATVKQIIDEVTVPEITSVGMIPSPAPSNVGFSMNDYIKSLEKRK